MDRATPSPDTDLSSIEAPAEPERLLIWVFRHWICGHVEVRSVHWSMVWRRLTELCGSADGTRAVTALEGMIRAICRHADRPILYHQPPCPCLGDDERRLVELVAACQQRQWLKAASWARGLVGEDGIGELIAAAARLAGLLAAHGQLLPGNGAPSLSIEAPRPTAATSIDRPH